MGLFDSFSAQDGLFGNIRQNVMPFAQNNNMALLGAGMGLLSGQGWGAGAQGFMQGAQADQNRQRTNLQQQLLTQDAERKQTLFDQQQADRQIAQQQRNATQAWIDKVAPKYSGLPASDALKLYLADQKLNGDVSFSKTPVYGTDKEGHTVLGTIGDNGTFKQIDTGDFNVSSGFEKIDTGTEIILRDKRSGQVVGVTPKENYQEAFDKSRGQGEGKTAAETTGAYNSITSKMPGLEAVVERLDGLADKATYTIAGKAIDATRRQMGMEPRDAAVARAEYTAIVDNQILPLLRDTFGAQFTQKEGETLRATLGDPDKSPAEKQALLRAFIEQKQRDIQALGNQMQRASNPSQSPSSSGNGVGMTTSNGSRILEVSH